MRLTHRSNPILFLFVVALLFSAMPSAAKEYDLTLDRDRPVGSMFKITIQGEQVSQQEQTVNGNPANSKTTKITGKIKGVAEVLRVHETKQTMSVAIKLDAFEGSYDDAAIEIELDKRVVATAVDGTMRILYEDGSGLPEHAYDVFDLLLGFMIEKQPSDMEEDKMFGLDQPRSPGDEWACNNELLAKDMSAARELNMDAKNIDGTVKFIELTDFNDKPAAGIDITIKLKEIGIPGLAEQGVKILNSGGQLKMAGKLPLDKASLDGSIKMTMAMSFEAGLEANGAKIGLSNRIDATVDSTYVQIK